MFVIVFGRKRYVPSASWGITRVKELLEAGLNVSFGHDDIFDPWYPLGTGNMLQVLHMGIHVSQLMGYEQIMNSIDLITTNSAKTLNIEESLWNRNRKACQSNRTIS